MEWPGAEMQRMIQLQRKKPIVSISGSPYGVGGNCYFYRIGEHGVEADVMMRFDDHVGEPLDPDAKPMLVSSPLDTLRAV